MQDEYGGGGQSTSNSTSSSDSSNSPDNSSTSKPTKHEFPSVSLKKQPGVLFNAGSLGNHAIDIHKIKLKVTLYHNNEKKDLTPYILQLKTSMALDQPAGRFTILLTFQKRWDAYIQSQDYVEICFSRYLSTPPLLMRGLVSNVRRTRIVDGSGKANRAITINGLNFGKIWSQYNIEYLVQEPGQSYPGIDVNSATNGLMANMLTENYGIGSNSSENISNSDLFQGVIDKMLNPFIHSLQQINTRIPKIVTKINVLKDYQITRMQIQAVQGTAFNLLNQYSNKPWCEFFIDDYGAGPTAFYRNTPFKSSSGNYIFSESKPDGDYFPTYEITDKDVIEEDLGKSDNEAYSYFFTYPALYMDMQTDPRAVVLGSAPLNMDQESSIKTIYNPHIDLDNMLRYGFKDLQIASSSIPVMSDKGFLELAKKMNKWLVEAFAWGPHMMNGTIRMKGNEHMRIGRYVRNTYTKEEFYIESVDHDIVMGQVGSLGNDNVVSFQTTIGVTRGRAYA